MNKIIATLSALLMTAITVVVCMVGLKLAWTLNEDLYAKWLASAAVVMGSVILAMVSACLWEDATSGDDGGTDLTDGW